MERDNLIEFIFNFSRTLHKKFFRDLHRGRSMHQMRLLSIVTENDGKPMKFFCDKLVVSKPNLTKVVNRLIEEGLLERRTDEKDRRIINLYITEKGKEARNHHKEIIKNEMLKKIEVLSDEDIETLNRNFKELESIFNKL